MVQFAVLPIRGSAWLCAVGDEGPEPLVQAPGLPDARHLLSADGRWLTVIDDKQKRAGLFARLDSAPWLEQRLPFAALPRECIAHTAIVLGETVLVGGHSKSGEMLWRRRAGGSGHWSAVEIPDKLRRPGKAIDGLHVHQGRLIAVDDIVTPKWLLLYAMGPGDSLALARTVKLPSHVTYERIVDTFLADDTLWCISRGINHGRASTHVWGVALSSFRERVCWSEYGPDPQESAIFRARLAMLEGVEPADPPRAGPLLGAAMAVQVGGMLAVACGDGGLHIIPLERTQTRYKPVEPRPLLLPGLPSVDELIVPSCADGAGLFAVSRPTDAEADTVWISAAALEMAAADGA